MKKRYSFFITLFFIGIVQAQNVGIGTTTPSSSAILDVNSTTKGLLPPRMSQSQRDLIVPEEGLMIYNTTTKKPNYYDGIEWKNYDGSSAQTFAVGVYYRGGIIAYLLQPGDLGYDANFPHGLIAAPTDQSAGIQWASVLFITTGATSTLVGYGNSNTNAIVANQGAGDYAAKLCADLVLGGYSDWYLPSLDELNILYLNKASIGGFLNYSYWSSTEVDNAHALIEHFLNGFQSNALKDNNYYVRAVRAF